MKLQLSEVHPELRQIAKRIPRFTFNRRSLWLMHILDVLRWIPGTPKDIVIENSFIPTLDQRAQIRLRFYKSQSGPQSSVLPPETTAPGLIWFHGGGYISGNPEIDDLRCIHLVRETGAIVVSVDYRYAPKHPYPTPLDDGYAALKWVSTHAGELGVDAERIAIGGDSAGGGLAAALAQLACDRREIRLVAQILVYPMLDDRTVLRADLAGKETVIWNQSSNRFGWESYLGKPGGAASVPAYAVPARREDLSGLPPAWIGVGTLDLFHNEVVAYAQRLQNCGVECELCVVPGAFHGFDMAAFRSQVAQDFWKAQITMLKKHLR